jgi:hypothetical protein
LKASLMIDSRRTLLFGASLLPGISASAQEPLPDASFRYRWTTIDALFARARKSRTDHAISLQDYFAIVRLLREEELVIFSEAGKHKFQNEPEAAYWHRGRLKFPSSLQNELRLLDEGKDPAIR